MVSPWFSLSIHLSAQKTTAQSNHVSFLSPKHIRVGLVYIQKEDIIPTMNSDNKFTMLK
jgi:hypothetical protein